MRFTRPLLEDRIVRVWLIAQIFAAAWSTHRYSEVDYFGERTFSGGDNLAFWRDLSAVTATVALVMLIWAAIRDR